MKSFFFIALCLFTIILSRCGTAKQMSFDYPDDIKDTAKKEFAKQFEKGKILYGITCARCHNRTIEGNSVIPDFSLPQLMDYEMRIQYPEHQDDMKDTNITADEMDWIVLFLRYRKKSNVPYR